MYPSINKTSGDWSFDLFTGFKSTKKVSWDTEGTYQCVGRKNYIETHSKQRSAVVTYDFSIGVRGKLLLIYFIFEKKNCNIHFEGIELKMTLNNNSRQVVEGDVVKLTCRKKALSQDDSDSNSFSNITWHWIPVGNKSATVEFGENMNVHLAPTGVKIVAQKLNGFTLSHLNWQNISTRSAGTFRCSHKQAGASSPHILAISSCIVL